MLTTSYGFLKQSLTFHDVCFNGFRNFEFLFPVLIKLNILLYAVAKINRILTLLALKY